MFIRELFVSEKVKPIHVIGIVANGKNCKSNSCQELNYSLTGSKNGADRIALTEYMEQKYSGFILVQNEIDELPDFKFRI